MPTEPSGNPGQLPDLDLRRRVAEAAGWTEIEVSGDGQQLWGYHAARHPKPERRYPGVIHAYELDIAAAWGLVEEMGKALYTINPPYGNFPDWRVGYRDQTVDSGMASQYAPTAPLAICLAYIAWKETTDAS